MESIPMNIFPFFNFWGSLELKFIDLNAYNLSDIPECKTFLAPKFMSNKSLFFMVQIKSDRSEAVKKYTKCSFTDHTDIALN